MHLKDQYETISSGEEMTKIGYFVLVIFSGLFQFCQCW